MKVRQPSLLPQHVKEDQSVYSTSFANYKFWPKVTKTLIKPHLYIIFPPWNANEEEHKICNMCMTDTTYNMHLFYPIGIGQKFLVCDQTYSTGLIKCIIHASVLIEVPIELNQTYRAKLVIIRN